jgi:hypothetical protein
MRVEPQGGLEDELGDPEAELGHGDVECGLLHRGAPLRFARPRILREVLRRARVSGPVRAREPAIAPA